MRRRNQVIPINIIIPLMNIIRLSDINSLRGGTTDLQHTRSFTVKVQ